MAMDREQELKYNKAYIQLYDMEIKKCQFYLDDLKVNRSKRLQRLNELKGMVRCPDCSNVGIRFLKIPPRKPVEDPHCIYYHWSSNSEKGIPSDLRHCTDFEPRKGKS